MIKATALKPVTTENMDIVTDMLTKRSQNIKIEYSQHADLVPHAVESLACRMLQLDADIRGFLNDLRVIILYQDLGVIFCKANSHISIAFVNQITFYR